MKKLAIAAAVIFTAGILSIHLTEKTNQPTSTVIKHAFYDYKKELASGD
jgi:hypothetical protein